MLVTSFTYDSPGRLSVQSLLSDGADESYDRIELKYNRQGEVTEIKDQNETVHAFDYGKYGVRC